MVGAARSLAVGNGFAQVLIAPTGDSAVCSPAPPIEVEFAASAWLGKKPDAAAAAA